MENDCRIRYGGDYYFQKNLQGDVIAIKDSKGNTVARYRYDAWGVPTIVEDTTPDDEDWEGDGIATVNPFRYRGYYYDNETGLYYLQSRYYDPTIGRFINADEPLLLMLDSLSLSLYTYCRNEPILLKDSFGFAPKQGEIPPASSGYVPPKGGPVKGKTKSGKSGWVDANGNVWVPDLSNHGGDHWDVTGKNGYINVGRNGHSWGGTGSVNLPKASKNKMTYGVIDRNGRFSPRIVFSLVVIFSVLLVGLMLMSGGAAMAFA